MRLLPILALCAALVSPIETHAASDAAAGMEALRATDLRLAVIADRLVTANAALCRDLQPALGFAFQAIDQYAPGERPAARAVFGFETGVSVEAVVPGTPAAATLQANDSLVAVGDTPIPPAGMGGATAATRDSAWAILAGQSPSAPLRLTVKRGGATLALSFVPRPACRAAFEVLPGRKTTAQSDGRIIQIGDGVMAQYTDEQLAVVVAHELAHIVLRHRARLEAAGVKWGLLSDFGKNARLFRQTEEEADLLSVALLRNAGYDPRIASDFWRTVGAGFGDGLASPTHQSAKARATAIDAEIARIPADAPTPYLPAVLATRDQPLS